MAGKKANVSVNEQAEQTAQGDAPNLRIEYMPLTELLARRLPDNPKSHDIGALITSFYQFGFTSPPALDERSGSVAFGHGRGEALEWCKREGRQPPKRIEARDGDWYVPTIRGLEFDDTSALKAYVIADNRLTELGGWDEPALAELLQGLQNSDHGLFEATGYDDDDLDDLLKTLAGVSDAHDDADASAVDIPEQYSIIVECVSEEQQAELLERLTEEGYSCRALIS